MAGQKFICRTSVSGEFLSTGNYLPEGIPVVETIENGKVEPGDEWALFRLTDTGLEFYNVGQELAAGIMSVLIDGQRAVQEIARFKTEDEAREHRSKALSPGEQQRTLVRSVRPMKKS